MFLALAGSVGEPTSAKVAAIDQKARLYPPKRSPWHGNADAAMKVTLWNGNGAGPPQKLKVDANLGGGRARDFYWFEAGKVSYGTQSRWSNGESIERRLTFAGGRLAAVQERRAANDRSLNTVAFRDVSPDELAKMNSSVASLLQECLKAPGLRDRKATVKAVEQDRVILQTAPGVEAWISRRTGDRIAPALVGRQVTYDFTAVDQDGHEMDYLNALQPFGKGVPEPPKAMLASAAPAAAAMAATAVAAPAVETPVVKKAAVKKKSTARKGTKKRARKKAPAAAEAK